MEKINKKCRKIRNLEERLACLEGKYNQLTDQLEEQRGNSSSNEETLDYHHILEERHIVERYIQKLTVRLSEEEKNPDETGRKDTIGPGKLILLVNNNHKLKLQFVQKVYSTEEKQISIDSPIGKAALGKRVGESIVVNTPKGKIQYKIASIE